MANVYYISVFVMLILVWLRLGEVVDCVTAK